MNFFKFLGIVSLLLCGISARGSKGRSNSRPSRGSYGSSNKGRSSYSYSSRGKGGKGGKGGNRGKGNKDGKDGKGKKDGYSLDINAYEFGLEFDEFYDLQSSVAICNTHYYYGSNCIDIKDEYLAFFDNDCDICIPQNYKIENTFCYNKLEYQFTFDSIYGEIKEIYQWNHQIKDIQVSQSSVKNTYGGYGEEEIEQVYIVKITVNKEYIEGLCEYRTCETEEFEVSNGKIISYQVTNININSRICEKRPKSWEKSTPSPSTSLPPTKPDSTTNPPLIFDTLPPTKPETTVNTPDSDQVPLLCGDTARGVYPTQDIWFQFTLFPDSAVVTFSGCNSDFDTILELYDSTQTLMIAADDDGCTNAQFGQSELILHNLLPGQYFLFLRSKNGPSVEGKYNIQVICDDLSTTAQPTTADPTTAQPTTAQPTTAEPTTAEPTTAKPTTAKPTTAEPTTAEPTTAEPTPSTTWQKSTASPTKSPSLKKCNYNCNEMKCSDNECDYGYKCVKENEYFDCDTSDNGYDDEYDVAYCPGICIKEVSKY